VLQAASDPGDSRGDRRLVTLGADDAGDCVELRGDVTGAPLDGVGRAERSVPGAYLLLGLMGQRRVDQVQQLLVLPEADPERDRNRDQRNDQPGAELVEVSDDAQLIAVPDRAPANW
jgi:hypothetical protein